MSEVSQPVRHFTITHPTLRRDEYIKRTCSLPTSSDTPLMRFLLQSFLAMTRENFPLLQVKFDLKIERVWCKIGHPTRFDLGWFEIWRQWYQSLSRGSCRKRGWKAAWRVRHCVGCNHANGSMSKCHIRIDVSLSFLRPLSISAILARLLFFQCARHRLLRSCTVTISFFFIKNVNLLFKYHPSLGCLSI